MPKPPTILLIERTGAGALSRAPDLADRGYRVEVCDSVHMAPQQTGRVDLAVLDAASMNTSGVRLVKELRRRLGHTPVLLVSARGADPSLDGAASVMLVEPFTRRKFFSRVEQLLQAAPRRVKELGPLRFDAAKRLVRAHGRHVRLTPKTAALLELFLARPGQTLSREHLLAAAWPAEPDPDPQTVTVHVRWLREAIEANASRPSLLKTVRGQGYRLELPPA
jgi:DNA-binding response OmpR family regulator